MPIRPQAPRKIEMHHKIYKLSQKKSKILKYSFPSELKLPLVWRIFRRLLRTTTDEEKNG